MGHEVTLVTLLMKEQPSVKGKYQELQEYKFVAVHIIIKKTKHALVSLSTTQHNIVLYCEVSLGFDSRSVCFLPSAFV